MSDLIDRQAAIYMICDLCDAWVLRCDSRDRCPNYPCAEIEYIMDVPAVQPEQQWIPCSERLPEEGQSILVTTTDNAWGDVVIIRTYYKEMHKSVIAWMPLPEPWEGKQDANR